MGGQGKPVNFDDLRSAVMSVGRELARVRLREVSRSPAKFEEGLRPLVNGRAPTMPSRHTWYEGY